MMVGSFLFDVDSIHLDLSIVRCASQTDGVNLHMGAIGLGVK